MPSLLEQPKAASATWYAAVYRPDVFFIVSVNAGPQEVFDFTFTDRKAVQFTVFPKGKINSGSVPYYII